FEWTAENQALWNALDEDFARGRDPEFSEDEPGAQFFLHLVFHMRVGELACRPEDVRQVADRIREVASDLVHSGSIVTEVSLTGEAARVEELRYQTNGTQSILDDSHWWDGWAEIVRSLTQEMVRSYHELARRAGLA